MSETNPTLRQELFARQNGLCHWCGCQMIFTPNPVMPLAPNEITKDHVYCAVGRKSDEIVGACSQCNNERSRIQQAFAVAHSGYKSEPSRFSLFEVAPEFFKERVS